MNKKTGTKVVALLVSVVGTALAIAGVDRGGITFGRVSGTDRTSQIIVDDVAYDTGSAAVIADGDPVTLGELETGQLVAVYGVLSEDGLHGKATLIVFDDSLDGPINWLDRYSGDGLFTALGQRVVIMPDTVFADSIVPASIEGLQVGMHVEVSGYPTGGVIEAAYIKSRPVGSRLEVTGYTSNVQTNSRKLQINGLEVRYRRAQMVGFVDGHPADGDLIEVRGWHLVGNGKLRATHVEKRPVLGGVPGSATVLDGFVQNFRTPDDVFLVAGTPVSLTESTQFENGGPAELGDGQRLRVEGHFDDYGRVIAEQIAIVY